MQSNNATIASGVTLIKDGALGASNDEIGSLTVASGGVITHSSRNLDGLALTVAGTLNVQAGGAIDVTDKGLRGGNNGSAFGGQAETYDENDAIVAGPVVNAA